MRNPSGFGAGMLLVAVLAMGAGCDLDDTRSPTTPPTPAAPAPPPPTPKSPQAAIPAPALPPA